MALKPTLSSMHDVELAGVAARGGRDAFGELVRRHGSAVRGLLRRMGAEPATADDIAQDAFLTAFEQITEFRGEGAFQAWVKRIAARLYVRHWRKGAHIDLHAETAEPEAAPHDGAGGASHQAAMRIDLDEALRTLSDEERLCVSLCYGGGLSHAEAAEALNTPLGTVKSHVKRGLDKLRRRLVPPEGDGGAERRAHG
jgi:RNA polymerase sigma factor (sigma-70 family)